MTEHHLHNPAPHNPQPAAPHPPAAAPAAEVVTDARGRKLVLRKLSVLDQGRLLRAIGPEQSRNEPYVNLVQQAALVSEIDGKPMPFPLNERMIDHILGEVGDDGISVLTARMFREFREIQARADAALLEGATNEGPLPRSA